jgi:hypothetical protein
LRQAAPVVSEYPDWLRAALEPAKKQAAVDPHKLAVGKKAAPPSAVRDPEVVWVIVQVGDAAKPDPTWNRLRGPHSTLISVKGFQRLKDSPEFAWLLMTKEDASKIASSLPGEWELGDGKGRTNAVVVADHNTRDGDGGQLTFTSGTRSESAAGYFNKTADGKIVYVHGYTRSNGTSVTPYWRSPPGSGTSSGHSRGR